MKKSFALVMALGLLAAGGPPADGATIPLQETFDDDPSGNAAPITQGVAWSESPNNDWTVEVDGAGRDYRGMVSVILSGGSAASWTYAFAPPVPGAPGSNFAAMVDFEIRRVGAETDSDAAEISLACLSAGVQERYWATYVVLDDDDATLHERLVLYEETNWAGRSVSTMTLAPVTNGSVTYSLSVTASYLTPGDPNSQLTLDAELTDGNTWLNASLIDPTPAKGSVFGLRLFAYGQGTGTTAITADFDDFEITPEPATLSLLVLGGLGLIRRRRQTQAE